MNCDKAAALLRSNQPPVEIKAGGMLIAAQIYQPNLLISEFHGPAHHRRSGAGAELIVNWKLCQSSVRGTPAAPERVSIVLDKPVVDRIAGGGRQNLAARPAHRNPRPHRRRLGRPANPVIEMVLRLTAASAPELHPAAVEPVDADITAVLRGLKDFAPKPWPVRFREMQAAAARIDITQARRAAGRDHRGRRRQLVAQRQRAAARASCASPSPGIEPFLTSDRRAADGAGLARHGQGRRRARSADCPGSAMSRASRPASTNLSLGINLLGEQTTLEGKRAVTLPLRFDDGAMLLGPIRIGTAPALF